MRHCICCDEHNGLVEGLCRTHYRQHVKAKAEAERIEQRRRAWNRMIYDLDRRTVKGQHGTTTISRP